MRKSMKLGASALAAVAIVAGSASAASAYGKDAFDEKKEPVICGNSADQYAGEDAEDNVTAGHGAVKNCQFGETNIFNYNPVGDNEAEYDGIGGTDLLGIIGALGVGADAGAGA